MNVTEAATVRESFTLIDESAPGLATPIPQNNAEAVGNARDSAAVGIAESVADLIVGDFLRGAMPDIAEFIAQTKMIAVTESVKAGGIGFFFKIEEPSRHLSMNPLTLKDAFVDHHLHYPEFASIWA